MKVVQINVTCGAGSTGKICLAVSELLSEKGVENYVLYSEADCESKNAIKYANPKELKLQALKSRVFGSYGFNSKAITKRLISHLERIKPDIVHLHNLHGHNCDLKALFTYFKGKKIKLFWTFHDCWAFTGYCTHFDMIGCNKWLKGCQECPQRKQYSWFFDKSEMLYHQKKELFADLNLTIITPSKWLANLVKHSFFKSCDIKVINNGIDLEIFKPTKSDFRERYSLENKKIVLGVAFSWDNSKGLDAFCNLSQTLSDEYKVVLVGVSEAVKATLPESILALGKTKTQKELAEIYTSADVFFNPTRQDTFPTVNIEALACGTPVVTFATGGSIEIVDESCGSVVGQNDMHSARLELEYICTEHPYSSEDCIKRAGQFDKNEKYREYLELYLK